MAETDKEAEFHAQQITWHDTELYDNDIYYKSHS